MRGVRAVALVFAFFVPLSTGGCFTAMTWIYSQPRTRIRAAIYDIDACSVERTAGKDRLWVRVSLAHGDPCVYTSTGGDLELREDAAPIPSSSFPLVVALSDLRYSPKGELSPGSLIRRVRLDGSIQAEETPLAQEEASECAVLRYSGFHGAGTGWVALDVPPAGGRPVAPQGSIVPGPRPRALEGPVVDTEYHAKGIIEVVVLTPLAFALDVALCIPELVIFAFFWDDESRP